MSRRRHAGHLKAIFQEEAAIVQEVAFVEEEEAYLSHPPGGLQIPGIPELQLISSGEATVPVAVEDCNALGGRRGATDVLCEKDGCLAPRRHGRQTVE